MSDHERLVQGESEMKEEERAKPDPTDPNAAAFPTEYDDEEEDDGAGA